MLKLCSWVALACALALPAQASLITGTVRVVDGDTIDVGDTRIRLHGIDALERGQTCQTSTGQHWGCGDWTTRQVRDRFEGQIAQCTAVTTDRYGRTVARCDVSGVDLGAQLVREGLAYAYVKYSTAYLAQEQHAFDHDIGIHGFSAQSPARYRLTRGRPEQRDAEGCTIKGNVARGGERIYHLPGQAFYSRTWISPAKGERWFCTEAQARASGWRRAQR